MIALLLGAFRYLPQALIFGVGMVVGFEFERVMDMIRFFVSFVL